MPTANHQLPTQRKERCCENINEVQTEASVSFTQRVWKGKRFIHHFCTKCPFMRHITKRERENENRRSPPKKLTLSPMTSISNMITSAGHSCFSPTRNLIICRTNICVSSETSTMSSVGWTGVDVHWMQFARVHTLYG